VRDVLLQTCYVSDRGEIVQAGGPTVKNVSGFDLCRLLVGARGTLGFLGDVIIRPRPRPQHSQWFTAEAGDPFPIFTSLYRPASVLWNGSQLWALLEGNAADVDAQAAACSLDACDGPPPLPSGSGSAVAPSAIGATGGISSPRSESAVHHADPSAAGQAHESSVTETHPANKGRVRSGADGSIPVSHSAELPFVAAPPGTLDSLTRPSAEQAAQHWDFESPQLLRLGMKRDLHV
jgi:glycolate oxidase FAD binding subunit